MNIFKLIAMRVFAGDRERRALDDYMRVEFKNEYRRRNEMGQLRTHIDPFGRGHYPF